ncbi:hypothetical protein JCM11491_005801 [Sporobolomyces phaffii]
MSLSITHASDSPSSRPFPTLPNELIGEILLESVLSTSDLARCCLVSRQFLPAARQLLYHSIRFTIYSDLHETGSLYALSRNSRVLRNTLASSTSLASLVRHLTLLPRRRPPEEPPSRTTSTWAAQIALCLATPFPHLERLSLPELADHSVHTETEIFSTRDRCLFELCLDGARVDRDFGPQSPPVNVKKLRCLVLEEPDARFHLPAALTVLDINMSSMWSQDFSFDFDDPGASRLEVIRLPIQAASTPLGRFTHLRHIVLHQGLHLDFDLTGASSIADCSSLKTLAFEVRQAPPRRHFLVFLLAFLLSSPPSLTRLEFPLFVPLDVLAALLDPTADPPFRLEILALSAGIAFDPKNAANFENLRSLCTSHGIQIELMNGRRDVFCEYWIRLAPSPQSRSHRS